MRFPLFFKLLHEADLMFMDILQGKGFDRTFLCIKADRDALNGSDVIHRTLLIKISQRDVTGRFVDRYGRDRCRDLLDQRQLFLPVGII